MTESNSSATPRGRPFKRGESGNPSGRPVGARNRTTLAVEAIIEGEAEALTRKVIELALNGDRAALRMCLDRLAPPQRERYVNFRLPPLHSTDDSMRAMMVIADGLAAGEITPGEAAEIGKFVESFVKVIEAAEFEQRLKFLEQERWKFKEARDNAKIYAKAHGSD